MTKKVESYEDFLHLNEAKPANFEFLHILGQLFSSTFFPLPGEPHLGIFLQNMHSARGLRDLHSVLWWCRLYASEQITNCGTMMPETKTNSKM